MSRPGKRELAAVSKIPLLSVEDVATLYQVLQALGFDIKTIALFSEKGEEETRVMFLDDGTKSSVGKRLTGADLARWCDLVGIKPGVVQRRLNFDESNLRLKKQGRSSMRVPMSWVGPPIFAMKGSVLEGRAFCDVSGLVSVPARSTFASSVMSQILSGKYPLRLQAIRDVVEAAIVADVQHPKLGVLQNALFCFPPNARTPDDVLDFLTKSEEMNVNTPPHNKQTQEEEMGVGIADQFRSEFIRRKLGPLLVELRSRSVSVAQLLHGWSIDIEESGLYPGELEVLLRASCFVEARVNFPALTQPFVDLGDWLKDCRLADGQRKVAMKTADTIKSPLFASEVPVITTTPVELPEKIRSAPKRDSLPAIATHTQIETDGLGLCWDIDRKELVVGVVKLSLEHISDVRLASGVKTAQRRIYDTFVALSGRSGIGAEFVETVGLDRHWVSGLPDGSSSLNSVMVQRIITGLKTGLDLTVTPKQLFGLAALPCVETPNIQTLEKKAECEELLFAIGDSLTAYRWTSLLVKYRSIWKWFRQNYDVAEIHIESLEKGEIGVPISVHLILMHKVKERIESSEGIVIPRSYQWLLKQNASQPVRDGIFVFDETIASGQKWPAIK